MLANAQHRKLIKMFNLLASKQPRTGQCTWSGPVQHTDRAQRRSCERFARYRLIEWQIYRQTDLRTDVLIYRPGFAELIDRCVRATVCACVRRRASVPSACCSWFATIPILESACDTDTDPRCGRYDDTAKKIIIRHLQWPKSHSVDILEVTEHTVFTI